MTDFNLSVRANGAAEYNDRVKLELRRAVEKYCVELVDEAGRLESNNKSTGGPPEVTTSNINDADILLRRGFSKPRRSLWSRSSTLVSPLGALMIGLIYDKDGFVDPMHLFWFVILLAITIAAMIYSWMKD